jgi:hypothetical protein
MTAGNRGGGAEGQREIAYALSSRAERGILYAGPGSAPARSLAFARDDIAPRALGPDTPRCQRCNFPVTARTVGCKNPCPNCGTVYPLGDCSD